MDQIKIKPVKGFNLDFKELWRYRELFYFLAWRDIKVRYKQTALGIVWAIMQPFLMMVVFSVIFGRVAGLANSKIPYPIFVYSGLLFWNYFVQSLSSAADSLISDQRLIQKVYFPRLIMPIATTMVFFVDFLFSTIVFIGLLIYYHVAPSLAGVLLFIPCLAITFLTSSGLGLFLSAINVRYRDIRYVLPFFIQLLIFLTPVIYPANILGAHAWVWYLNPMSGIIETMRAGLFGISTISWGLLFSAAAMSMALFILGIFYFKRSEKSFADIL